MKKQASIIALICIFIVTCVAAASFATGTPEQAKEMVEKAAAFYKANGKDKSISAFNDPKGQFRNDDLFIFMLDMNGMCYAHFNLVGKSLFELRDADGKYFVKEQIEIAKKGSGWVDYKWTNPTTKKIQQKTSFIKRVDDNHYIGCGAFK
jgi:cytochrome c